MARIRNYTVTLASSTLDGEANNITPTAPAHVAGDVIIAFVVKDDANGAFSTSTPGYSAAENVAFGASGANTVRSAFTWKVAASGAETMPTLVSSDVDAMICVCMSIEGADTLDVIDGFTPFTANNFAAANIDITTTANNCLLLYFVGSDSGSQSYQKPSGGAIELDYLDDGSVGANWAYSYQPVAGAAETVKIGSRNASGDEMAGFVVAINDGSGGTIVPAVLDPSTNVSLLLSLNGSSVAEGNVFTTGAADEPLAIPSIDGIATGLDLAGQSLDTGYNFYRASTSFTPAQSGTIMRGFGVKLPPGGANISGRFVVGSYLYGNPRDFYDQGAVVDRGMVITLADSANQYKSWIFGANDATDCRPDQRNFFIIQVDQTTPTTLDASTPAFDSADLDDVYFTSLARRGSMNVYLNGLLAFDTIILAGNPIDFIGLTTRVGYFCIIPIMIRQSESAALCLAPLQVGGGASPCNLQLDACAIQFPQRADFTSPQKKVLGHFDEGALGITFKLTAAGTARITNSLIGSATPWHFRFDAATSALATYNFAGLTLVNAQVTLRAVNDTISGVVFSGCPVFTQNGATLDGCTVSNTTVTSDDPSKISNSVFFTDAGGHGIVLTVPGTYTFTGNTFDGFGADGGTDAAVYNNSGGAVTLNIAGGGDTPTVRNGVGASTTVVSGATVTFTGLPTGVDVVILQAGTNTVLLQVDEHPATSFSYGYEGTPTVDVGFIKPGLVPLYIRDLILSTTDSSIPVSLTADRNYL